MSALLIAGLTAAAVAVAAMIAMSIDEAWARRAEKRLRTARRLSWPSST